jgi:competence protein ComEC
VEINFVDVGLGSCQIIHLGDQSAIVIDCGLKSDHIALQFLKKLGIVTIRRLITSHSDNDHTGGAVSILDAYQDNIEQILAVQDHKWLETKYWQRIDYFIRKGVLMGKNVKRLEIESTAKQVWGKTKDSRLRLFSPSFIENQKAQVDETANGTSAVLVLDHLGHRVVFAGDSELPQWKEILERRNQKSLDCDVLTVSHHGGLTDATDSELDWLYAKAISAKFAVLSVGTRQNPKHPRPEIVARLLSNGAKVLCTQLTNQCHDNPSLLHPAVLTPLAPFGRSADDAARGQRSCIGCAGTIVATISNAGCNISRLREHQSAVDKLANDPAGHPLCRN